jgi:SPP1 family predicted phage head-tail adaptor
MRAGMQRHRMTAQARTVATDEYGDVQGGSSWDAITTLPTGRIWCEIEQLSGKEGEIAHSIHPTATHRIRTRYMSEIDSLGPEDRFTWTKNGLTHTYNIVARDDKGHRERMIEFMVKELVS